jgi:hypothetical protein
MSVRRSANFLNQQRIDRPHLLSIESAVRSDFDELISSFAIGADASYVIRGFELNMVGAVGASASSLQMIVENSSLFHGKSTEAGTFFQVASGVPNQTINSTTNTAVQGSFTPGSLNYIGLEFSRAVDNSTSAQVFLWNPTNKNEISKTVPLAETLNYKIVVSSSIWAANVLPVSIVETDSSNNVLAVQDRRPMLFRLGSGGSSTPDPFNVYPWTNHAEGRTENYWDSSSSVSPFRGGDKQILHFKEWADAIMSNLLEIKGTTYWYSENSGGSIVKLRGDLALLQMTGSGKFMHAASTAGQMNWTSDIFLNYIGSRLSYKILANPVSTDLTLANDEVAYLNIVRGVDVVPSLIFTQSSAVVSSVGAVSWTGDVLAGDYIKVGASDDTKYYQILSVDSASQVTLTETYVETSTGSSGVQAKYAYGYYEVVAVPSTNRHMQIALRKDVPFDEDAYWLFLRADNGGSTARVYLRGSSGGELQQGEDREISDNQALDILEYIGSPAEVDTTPDYTNAIVTGVAEQRTYTLPAAASLTTGQYSTINSALDVVKFYIWVNIDGAGGDPAPAGLTPIEVALLSTDTNLQVASKFQIAIDASPYFESVDNLDGTISVNNSQVGVSSNAVDIDMGGTFSITVDAEGIGSYNSVVVDDENLTRSIKRLDDAVGAVQAAIDTEPYQEIIEIVSGAPSNDREVTGPVVALTNVKIPKNTRNGDVQETFVVDKADIEIHLNGQELTVGKDYNEIGISGDDSTEVEFTFQLEIGDILDFRKISALGAGGGGGAVSGVNLGSAVDADVFKQTIGSQLQFRRLEAGSNMTITESADKITFASSSGIAPAVVQSLSGVNYTILSSDDVIHMTNAGGDRTLTLPSAVATPGKIFYIKKIDAGNTLFIKSVLSQTLDGVDIDAAPYAIATQFESITLIAVAGNWFIH